MEKYDKLHACAKHFAVHSGPEWNRHSFNVEDISLRDLYETYLPAFKALVQKAGVKEVMCAYNRFEGEPCCGSNRLLTDILRNEWGFEGLVVSDCGAINDFYEEKGHKTHADSASASSDAVLSGTDLECGASFESLVKAVKSNKITEKAIDKSLLRLLKARFDLGEMDAPEEVSWSKIPFSVVASKKHDSLALQIARESMTLLHNPTQALPLKRGGLTVAVMGPNANDSIMQWGNYNGMPAHTVTILDGIKSKLGADDKLIYEQGCPLVGNHILESVFQECRTGNEKGFTAKYWNNLDSKGQPVVQKNEPNPFNFCTAGATAFAPEVNLTDFSATYTGTYVAKQNGRLLFNIYSYGMGSLMVNNKQLKSFEDVHGGTSKKIFLDVEAGKTYNIQLDFKFLRSDAQLNFDIGFLKNVNISKSIRSVKEADVVVFVGGISPSLEGEEMTVDLPGFLKGDRINVELPDVQRQFLSSLHKAGKKVVFVNCSGSFVGLEPEINTCDAILQAWYPGQQGGMAVAEVLFGEYNPSGRLPITFYKNANQLPDFENYDMADRTYRFTTQKPLFVFGHGLSYTSFEYGKAVIENDRLMPGQELKFSVPVSNIGKLDGEEIVQVYLAKKNDMGGPIKTLRSYKRVIIPAGQTVNVEFSLSDEELSWWNENKNKMTICPGDYVLYVGSSSADSDLASYPYTIL